MRWRTVQTMWASELRQALRERSIVVNSVLVPLLLYPLVMWLTTLGLELASGQTAGFVSRVALCDVPPAQVGLVQRAEASPRLALQPACDSPEATARAVRAGDLDAALWLTPTPQPPPLPADFTALLQLDGSRDRSVEAARRLRALADVGRERWFDRALAALGAEPGASRLQVELHNAASQREMGAFLAGILIPLMLVVMVAMGCQAPAVDATAGERERGTWETLMSSAAARLDLVLGKYLAVASLGVLAGVLNVAAMLLTLRALFGPAAGVEAAGADVQLPLRALPVLVGGTVAVALLVAAGSMLLAAFARTYKDGQAMAQPFLLVLVLGVTLVQQPDARLTVGLALTPVAGVMLAMREALAGPLALDLLALVATSQALAIAGCVVLAAWVLRAEDVVIGSFDGSLWTFVRERLRRRAGRPP